MKVFLIKSRNFSMCLFAVLLLVVFSTTPASAQEGTEEGVEETAEERLNASKLEEFAEQDGIIRRPSGLLIKIITQGEGGIISPHGRAIVHYEGRLADGTVFDSSYEHGQPAALPVGGVIRGWEEALLLMQIGSKWEIAIPSDIAYGRTGQRNIGPNANLFFTLELLGQL